MRRSYEVSVYPFEELNPCPKPKVEEQVSDKVLLLTNNKSPEKLTKSAKKKGKIAGAYDAHRTNPQTNLC